MTNVVQRRILGMLERRILKFSYLEGGDGTEWEILGGMSRGTIELIGDLVEYYGGSLFAERTTGGGKSFLYCVSMRCGMFDMYGWPSRSPVKSFERLLDRYLDENSFMGETYETFRGVYPSMSSSPDFIFAESRSELRIRLDLMRGTEV